MANLKIALLVAVIAQCTYVALGNCPGGWTYSAIVDRCWRYTHQRKSMERGQEMCKGMDGTLPMPTTALIQQELVHFRNDKVGKRDIWIGLNDKKKNWQFVWDDGKLLINPRKTTPNNQWNNGEPNNGGFWNNEHCVHLVGHNGRWNDRHCRDALDIVCEKRAAPKNPCAASPCKNGAKCKNLKSGFKCQCRIGFTGKNCDAVSPVLILNRVNGKINFDRNWRDYERGFGHRQNCNKGDCWIGLDSIHNMCSKNCMLKMSMTYKGINHHADYTTFKVGPKSDKYRLTIGGYSGDWVNDMSDYNNMQFSTKDSDNDLWASNCAESFTGGWWYKACHKAHPTGIFGSKAFAKGINWKTKTTFTDSLSSITMTVTRS